MKILKVSNFINQTMVLFVIILLMVVSAGNASGATFTVDSTSDTIDADPGNGSCADSSGDCTLRAAVMEANALSGSDTINIPAGTYTLTLITSSEDTDTEEGSDLDISESVTITGAGISDTIITIDALHSGEGKDRIFEVTSNNVTIKKLKITGGSAQTETSSSVSYGSGIFTSGTLTLEDVLIDSNGPPAPYTGQEGGGIASWSDDNSGGVTMTRVTVSNNNGGTGAGIYLHKSYLELNDSTISDNTEGSGIYANDSIFDIYNSTISGHSSNPAVYQYADGGLSTISNSTITDTSNDHGVHLVKGYIYIGSSIIAGNGDDYIQAYDLYKEPVTGIDFYSEGYSFIGNIGYLTDWEDEAFYLDSTNQIGTRNDIIDPQLDELADNGGTTETHALLSDSTAIDAYEETDSGTDQRGAVRPVDGDGDATAYRDIGAYEYGGVGLLSFTSSALSVDEGGGSKTVTVSRKGGSDAAVSVDYTTSNGTSGSGDYTFTSGTLDWSDSDSADKTFSVSITDDSTLEDDETINLSLSNATGGADLGTDYAILTIVDDEEAIPGTLSFTSSSFSVDEDGTSKTVTVSRSGGSEGAVSVDYATSDKTAGSGDYTSASGTLDWSDGDSDDKSFTVSITDDNVEEGNETISLDLSNTTGGASLGTDSATLTIVDDDEAGTLAFTSSTYSVSEDGTSKTVTVSRTGGSDGAVSVGYATSNGTAGSGDYTSASGTLNWSNGDSSSKTFSVSITDDSSYEGDETINLSLSNATGGASLGTDSATLTITEDDEAVPGTLSFTSSTLAVDEDGTSITVNVSRSSGSDGAVSVDYATSNGTAGSGDYTSASGTLNWSDGDSDDKTFSVSITDDSTLENDETINLTLSNATGGASLDTDSATLTITEDDEAAPGTISFSSSSYSVNEDGTSITVSVSRSGGSDGAVSVDYATSNGTATSGSDYTEASGTLDWSDGDSTDKTFDVSITNDSTVEGDETINLTLDNASGRASLGTDSATLTITEDASKPVFPWGLFYPAIIRGNDKAN